MGNHVFYKETKGHTRAFRGSGIKMASNWVLWNPKEIRLSLESSGRNKASVFKTVMSLMEL